MNKEIRNIVESALGPFVVRNNVTDIGRFMDLLGRIVVEVNASGSLTSFKSKAQDGKLLQDALPLLPVLEDAFASLSPSKAMDLFEKRHFFLLRNNWNTWNFWLDQHTPFYTYQDLLCLIQMFERYMNRHRKSLLTTGYPKASFEESPWLYYKLARLYPIKIPALIRKEQSRDRNRAGETLRSSQEDCSLTYFWSKEIRYWQSESRIEKRCSYEEAPVFPRLTPKDIEGIERIRSIVLGLKIRILKIASKSLASKSSNRDDHLSFWNECIDVISEMVYQEDFQLLKSIDEQYSDVAWGCGFEDEETGFVFSNPITGRSEDMPVGGIANLLEFIFFIERELTIGRMHNTKTKLLSTVGNGTLRSYWRLITDKRISSHMDKLVSEFWQYYQQEDRLNQELNERLATDLSKKLRVPLYVKAEYYNMFQLMQETKKVGIDIALDLTKTISQRPGIIPIQLPLHTRWEDITIKFVNGFVVIITALDFRRKTDYIKMGFENKKALSPNIQWKFLRDLSEDRGELSRGTGLKYKNIKKTKSLLSKTLREYFNLDSDPFLPFNQVRNYKTRFNLIPESDEGSGEFTKGVSRLP